MISIGRAKKKMNENTNIALNNRFNLTRFSGVLHKHKNVLFMNCCASSFSDRKLYSAVGKVNPIPVTSLAELESFCSEDYHLQISVSVCLIYVVHIDHL